MSVTNCFSDSVVTNLHCSCFQTNTKYDECWAESLPGHWSHIPGTCDHDQRTRHHWSAVERRPDPLMTSVQVYSQQYFQTLCWWITLHIQMYSSQQEVSNIIGEIDAGPSTSLYHLPLANWSLCTQTNIAFPNQNMIRIFTSQ